MMGVVLIRYLYRTCVCVCVCVCVCGVGGCGGIARGGRHYTVPRWLMNEPQDWRRITITAGVQMYEVA